MNKTINFFVFFLSTAFLSVFADDASDHMLLAEIESKLGLKVEKESDPAMNKILNMTRKKFNFEKIETLKAFSTKMEELTKKVDSKKLGKARLAYKKTLLYHKKLKREVAKDKPSLKKAKKIADDVLESIQKLADSSGESGSDSIAKARQKFSEVELRQQAKEAHAALLTEKEYVSATKCQSCHPVHFDQWSKSQHAYSQLSPVYMAMQNAINHLTSKTNGDFCIRCHNQVGMNKEESTFFTNLDRHPASREGINCIVCHRISSGGKTESAKISKGSLEYGKVSGRLALHKGDIKDLVYGPRPDDEVKSQIDSSGSKNIHKDVGQFTQLSKSGFCSTCHDVNLYNGFRLEEAFSEYKSSPAAKQGISCQDCHMGVIQGDVVFDKNGKVSKKNYRMGKIATSSTRDRKMTDHTFSGPDYSVIHPALFPTSDEIISTATISDWIKFDYEAGWGSKRWEEKVGKEQEGKIHKSFLPDEEGNPNRWMYKADRIQARKIILRQFEKIKEARRKRLQVLKRGYRLVQHEGDDQYSTDKISVTRADSENLKFHVGVKNGTNGHNVPTGFIGERLVWMYVQVFKQGMEEPVFQSGDLDPNGDVRDQHSFFVHGGTPRWKIADGKGAQRLLTTPKYLLPEDEQVAVKPDLQLFNLQSKFITRNFRGGEREQILAINHSVDTLPFIRPSSRSTVLTGQPVGARIHRLGLPTNATRKVSYNVKKKYLKGPGQYKIVIQFKSAMLPVNLVKAISIVGFDYGMTPKEVARRVVFGFQQEREAIRYYAIDDQNDLEQILKNKIYVNRAKTELKHRLQVTDAQEQEKMIARACVTYYAHDVATKKVEYAMKLFKDLPQGMHWFQSKEFMDIKSAIERSPMDNLLQLKTFLMEKLLNDLSEKEQTGISKIIKVIDHNEDMNKYWPDAKTRSQVANGLIIPKVTGHEILYQEEKVVEIVKN